MLLLGCYAISDKVFYKEVEEANQKLSQLASVDDLTQLANRRVFSERLQQEWRRRNRTYL